jgi:hypothetical protein
VAGLGNQVILIAQNAGKNAKDKLIESGKDAITEKLLNVEV